jgi:hypothetical protein
VPRQDQSADLQVDVGSRLQERLEVLACILEMAVFGDADDDRYLLTMPGQELGPVGLD